ncbi:Uncharacterized protein Adt_31164 [Abeliophyllum distichum]|uniref:PAS domain-containing protein n=1 Tax=Abeliophyllum distichum TaxID=126358 RepID=A0ABD1RDB5_9LAMI
MAKKKVSHSHQEKAHQKQEEPVQAPQQDSVAMENEASVKLESLKSLNQRLLKEAMERRKEVESLMRSKGSLESDLTRSNSELDVLRHELTQVSESVVNLEMERSVLSVFVGLQVGHLAEVVEEKTKGLENKIKDLLRVIDENKRTIGLLNEKLIESGTELDSERKSSRRVIEERDEMKGKIDVQIEEANEGAYDRATIKFRGVDADINFNISDYEEDMEQERAIGMKTEANALPVFSNWPWKIQSHGVITPVPLLSSAASSGFSLATIPHSNSVMSLNAPTDEFGWCSEWNSAMTKLSGWSREDVINKMLLGEVFGTHTAFCRLKNQAAFVNLGIALNKVVTSHCQHQLNKILDDTDLDGIIDGVLIAYQSGLIILWDVVEARVVAVQGDKVLQLKNEIDSQNNVDTSMLDETSPHHLEDKEISAICWASSNGSLFIVIMFDVTESLIRSISYQVCFAIFW